jgi:hypothetical protein
MGMKKGIPKQAGKVGNTGEVEEAAAMIMMTKTIIKDRHVRAVEAAGMTMIMIADIEVEEEVVITMMMTIKHLHAAAAEAHAAVKDDAVMTTTMITKALPAVAAETHAVEMAEVGMEMKKNIPAQQGKAGEIVIDYLNLN